MLPFKCFHCGKVGHFSSKFTFKENKPMKKKEKARTNPGSLKRKSLLKGTIFIQKRIMISFHTLNKKNMS
jgi:hypothetical protein